MHHDRTMPQVIDRRLGCGDDATSIEDVARSLGIKTEALVKRLRSLASRDRVKLNLKDIECVRALLANQNKPYKCRKCGKRFRVPVALSLHRREICGTL